jgi:glycosyltransferase involved in cell wall biosynthesis
MSRDACLSVVIPTRNRRQVLESTLNAIDAQEGLPAPIEVIVADDGSTDGTVEALAEDRDRRFALELLTLRPGGPARARNRAIERATAARVLLLGDDTIPAPGALAAHLQAAGGEELAIQGRIDWDPAREVTEVMRYLAPEGPQFYFKGLAGGRPIPFTAVLGSNLSAPTRWFREEPFDERFTDACLEDTEQAWRWQRRGWKVVFSEASLCWHRHRYDTIDPFVDRQRRAGGWARLAVRLHPTLLLRLVLQPVLFSVVVLGRHVGRSLVGRGRVEDRWDLRCRMAFARGFLEGPPKTSNVPIARE